MSYLINLLKNNMLINPLYDIKNFLNNIDKYNTQNITNGITTNGLPSKFTPLMLLWMNKIVYIDAIEELILNHADMDLFGIIGLNPLYIILILIFYNVEYIDHLEYWLSIGANPNKKYIDKNSKVFTSLEFFINHLENVNWKCQDFEIYNYYDKINLTNQHINRIIIILLSFNVELSENIYNNNLIYCRSLNIHNISESEIIQYPILEKKLYNIWKIPFPISDFFMRHKFLSKYINLFNEINQITDNNDIIFTSSFEKEININNYLYMIEENNKTFYFSSDLIPKIIKSGKNPLTNNSINYEIRKNWIKKLHKEYPAFPYKLKSEIVSELPKIFYNDSKLSDEINIIEYLNEWMIRIHPYTNIMNINQWNENKIIYISQILSEIPYSLSKFENINSINKFLNVIIYYIFNNDIYDILNKTHFAIEEIIEDIKTYESIILINKKLKINFNYSFFEAILIPEIYDVLYERINFYNLNEMSNIYNKICRIHYIELDLNENTLPILILN